MATLFIWRVLSSVVELSWRNMSIIVVVAPVTLMVFDAWARIGKVVNGGPGCGVVGGDWRPSGEWDTSTKFAWEGGNRIGVERKKTKCFWSRHEMKKTDFKEGSGARQIDSEHDVASGCVLCQRTHRRVPYGRLPNLATVSKLPYSNPPCRRWPSPTSWYG